MACSLAELISEARIAHRSPPASLRKRCVDDIWRRIGKP
jgi:hypothetical protein